MKGYYNQRFFLFIMTDFSFNFPFLHSPDTARSCCYIYLACLYPLPQLPDRTWVFVSSSEEGLAAGATSSQAAPEVLSFLAISVTGQHQLGVPGRGTAQAAAAPTGSHVKGDTSTASSATHTSATHTDTSTALGLPLPR